MFFTEVCAFLANCPSPRSWSSRVIAENWEMGMSGALFAAIRQLVLQGLPTTTVLHDFR